jgi:hypothetical protein
MKGRNIGNCLFRAANNQESLLLLLILSRMFKKT